MMNSKLNEPEDYYGDIRYLVTSGEYSDYRVLCATDTLRMANECAKRYEIMNANNPCREKVSISLVPVYHRELFTVISYKTLVRKNGVYRIEDEAVYGNPICFDGSYIETEIWRGDPAGIYIKVSGADRERVKKTISDKAAYVSSLFLEGMNNEEILQS